MTLLDRLIRFSLGHRVLVLFASGLLLVLGGAWIASMPLDIFPDLSAPTVTVITEAPGMAPEEVEVLVTFPVESAVNGATGIRSLRSVSADGISVVWVEFAWGTDVFRARQVIAERLQRVELPAQASRPELGPVSSIMGEITFVALTSDTVSPMELRRLAETVVRRGLLAIPGISQVVPIGGEVRQLQVTLRPAALAERRVSVDEVIAAVARASRAAAAGFHVEGGQEYLVRGLGRARHPEEVAAAVVAVRDGVPVRVGDLGEVAWGAEPARGTAAYRTRPAVILSVQKQPGANTLDLTRRIDEALSRLSAALPAGVVVERENFRQADFIAVAIGNVTAALRDGAVLVVLVLFLFLGSWRTTLISAVAIPLSLVAGVLVVSLFGGTLNTMTLGGLTIAIGALVDDAIIDVENVFRRLRLELRKPAAERRPALAVVFRASSEVRKAIFFATLIIALVFLPLFLLPGIEGRLLRPLGLAYVAALAASLVVSLTVTPVLCSLLLPRTGVLTAREPWLLRTLHRAYRPSLDLALARRGAVLAAAALLIAAAVAVLPFLGRSFLPPFNEGSLTVSVVSTPGIPLAESDRLGRLVEAALLELPEVVSTSRRTGRAERDEHVQGVNASEMEVVLGPLDHGRDKEELLAAMRRAVATIPGATVSFGQPISHRIDHMISGSRTSLAVKLFGPDLAVLRELAGRVEEVLAGVDGLVDLSNQEQAVVPQLVVDFDRTAMARHGLSADGVAAAVEALFQGVEVGEVVDRGTVSRVVVRFPEALRRGRERLADLPVTTPEGELLRLDQVADVRFDLGPSMIRREDVQRVAMLTANVAGADLAGTVERAREAVDAAVDLPAGYLVTFGGQFEEAARSTRNLAILAVVILCAMYGLLYVAFGSHRETLVVLVNLPLALIGGVFAVAVGDGVLSIATLVGFVTLFGVATRNGVLLVTHYQSLIDEEGLGVADAVRRGSAERLAPILMTALTAGLALVPLLLHGDAAGNEIQSPMAGVILGGLLTSTFLNLIVVPVLYVRWGRAGAGGAGRAARYDGGDPMPAPPTARSALAVLLLAASLAAAPPARAAEAPEPPDPLRLEIGDPARRQRTVEPVLDAGVDTRSGETLSFDGVAARLDGVGLVLVGEEHDSIEAHRVQLGVIAALQARGRPVAVGLEMLPVTVQPALDRWTAGELSEDELLEAVDWYEHWGLPWGYYRDVFVFAREHRLPVFALNVPRQVVRAVGRGAAGELPPELARYVPPAVDLASADHRTLVRALFAQEAGMHGGLDDERFEAMFAAQATWDAAMAHAAARALAGLPGREPVLVVLVGSGHVAYGLGVERQARAWLERPSASVVPLPVRDEDGEPTGPVRASYADVVWGLPPAGEPFYPGLGLSTVDADPDGPDDRRRVIFVAGGSAAEAAGFAAGDLLLAMDGRPLPDRRELARRLAGARWGDRAVFRVEREGRPVELTVLFRRAAPAPAAP